MDPLTLTAASPTDTFALGEALGRVLAPGDFVALAGELGAGKTQLARGIAAGAGANVDDVSSPTYAILQSYAGRLRLHHADLYRLKTEADLYATGYFDLLDDPRAACVVEWAEQVPGAIPEAALRVHLVKGPGPDDRTLVLTPQGGSTLGDRWAAALAQRSGPQG